MLKEIAKHPRPTSQTPQTSVSMLKVKVRKLEKKTKWVWIVFKDCQEKTSLLKNKHGSIAVCNAKSEQTTTHLEQCPLDRRDHS